MKKSIKSWYLKMQDPNYEPAWQEPLEWMSIGALIMTLFLVIMM